MSPGRWPTRPITILASSLFLYGIAGVTRRFPIRIGTLGAGGLIFLVACVLLITV